MPLFKLSLIGLVFLLVPMVYGVYHLVSEGSIMLAYSEDAATQWQELLAYRRYSALMIPVAFLLYGVFLTGAARVYRRFAYNEGYVLLDDFANGIKDNYKGNIIMSLVYGFVFFALYFGISLFSGTDGIYLHYAFLLFYFIFLCLAFAAMTVSIFLRDIYKNTGWGYFKASWILVFRHLPYAALMILVTIFPFALFFAFNGVIPGGVSIIAVLILDVLYGFGGISLSTFGSFLFFAHMADETINKKSFPEQYRKGLYKEGGEDA